MSEARCFVAIELPQHIAAALLDAGAALRTAAVQWREEKWVAEHNLHVTLKFLGNVDQPRLSAMVSEISAALRPQPGFVLSLESIRAVSSRGRTNMIWATFCDPADRCADLSDIVEEIAVANGIDRGPRRFVPHVTLARARRPKHLASRALELANDSLCGKNLSMSVLSATLFTSALTPSGPVYERVQTWTFQSDL